MGNREQRDNKYFFFFKFWIGEVIIDPVLAVFKFWFHEIFVVTKKYYFRVVFDLVLYQKQLVYRANWSYFFKACFLPMVMQWGTAGIAIVHVISFWWTICTVLWFWGRYWFVGSGFWWGHRFVIWVPEKKIVKLKYCNKLIFQILCKSKCHI